MAVKWYGVIFLNIPYFVKCRRTAGFFVEQLLRILLESGVRSGCPQFSAILGVACFNGIVGRAEIIAEIIPQHVKSSKLVSQPKITNLELLGDRGRDRGEGRRTEMESH